MAELLSIIAIVAAIVNIAFKSKKLVKNAPGQKASEAHIDESDGKNAAPTASATPAAPVGSAQEPPVPDDSDLMPADVSEGESRECDHGSTGGSMDITSHEGMGEAFVHAKQQVQTTVATTVATTVKTRVKVSRDDIPEEAEVIRAAAARDEGLGAMTVEQMRQAVIMAEILKRPSERFRRWPAR